tara:strand:- start:1 stop:381 length:381 start_codon:yes stop_codon:yes gene_type:complete
MNTNTKIIMDVFKNLEAYKLSCKITIITNMDYIKHNNKTSKLNALNNCTMACLESIEVCDLCQYFIASKSSSMDSTIKYTISILKNTIELCSKTGFDTRLKEVNIQTTSKQCKLLIKALTKLRKHL